VAKREEKGGKLFKEWQVWRLAGDLIRALLGRKKIEGIRFDSGGRQLKAWVVWGYLRGSLRGKK